jgi:hypothetical protein
VENWIERVAEPRRLFLAWQAPDHMNERYRWAVGILEPAGNDCTLRYLYSGAEFERRNPGRTFDELLGLGYQGYPAFPLRREMHVGGVLSAFMRRLPPRTRSDFEEYKRQFRLAPHLSLTDFALLGQTEAKLPSDGFSVVDPLDGAIDRCDLMLEAAGYRHYAASAQLAVGDLLTILAEPENEHDPNAVVIRAANQTIGYINRLQTGAFQRWLAERDVSGIVERLNGRPERPRAFAFVRVRPTPRQMAD